MITEKWGTQCAFCQKWVWVEIKSPEPISSEEVEREIEKKGWKRSPHRCPECENKNN